jgi:hypothetical protein
MVDDRIKFKYKSEEIHGSKLINKLKDILGKDKVLEMKF